MKEELFESILKESDINDHYIWGKTTTGKEKVPHDVAEDIFKDELYNSPVNTDVKLSFHSFSSPMSLSIDSITLYVNPTLFETEDELRAAIKAELEKIQNAEKAFN